MIVPNRRGFNHTRGMFGDGRFIEKDHGHLPYEVSLWNTHAAVVWMGFGGIFAIRRFVVPPLGGRGDIIVPFSFYGSNRAGKYRLFSLPTPPFVPPRRGD